MKARNYIAITILATLTACTYKMPVPPMGENMGSYGYVNFQVQYEPNFNSMFSRPNPDIPSEFTLNQK